MPSYHKHGTKTALVPVLMAYAVSREVLREWAGRGLPATPLPVSHLDPDPAQEPAQLGVSVAALAALDTQSAEARVGEHWAEA